MSPGPEEQDVQSTMRGETEDFLRSDRPKKVEYHNCIVQFDPSSTKWRIFLCACHRTPENVQIIRKLGKPTCGSFYLLQLERIKEMRRKTNNYFFVTNCNNCWYPWYTMKIVCTVKQIVKDPPQINYLVITSRQRRSNLDPNILYFSSVLCSLHSYSAAGSAGSSHQEH